MKDGRLLAGQRDVPYEDKTMLKLYLVDDEIMAIDYFRMLLSRCKTSFEMAGYSENSRIACAEILEKKPDAVFVDINMPGMTGIELADEVLGRLPDTRIVFLTAYRDFDFVRRGMELGIESYLLKNELNVTTLQQELDKLEERIAKDRDTVQIRKNEARRSLFSGRPEEAETIFPDLRDGRQYCLAGFVNRRSFSMQRMQELLPKQAPDPEQCRLTLEENGFCPAAFAKFCDYVWLILFTADGGEDEPGFREKLLSFLKDRQNSSIPFCLPFFQSVREAVSAVRELDVFRSRRLYFGERGFIRPEELGSVPAEQRDFSAQEEQFRRFLDGEAEAEERKTLSALLQELSLHAPDEIFIKYAQLIFSDYMHFMKQHHYLEQALPEWENREFTSVQEYARWIRGLASEFSSLRNTGKRVGYSEKTACALNIIEKRYQDCSLSVQAVADEMKISAGHLRKLFKDEMKVTLSDYLNEFRLEKAKRMLSGDDVRITELYRKVGFGSSQYFSTAFRKYTGMTPKEYQKKQAGGSFR